MLESGVAAVALSAFPRVVEGADGDEIRLRRLEEIEPEKYPWGWIRWLLSGQIDAKAEMTMGLVHFEPNQINTRHVHPNSAEYLHALAGVSEHLIGDRWVELKPGDTLRIPKGVPHQARTKAESFRALIVYDTPKRIMIPVSDRKPPLL